MSKATSFDKLMKVQGAAIVLASILIGRVIDSVAKGFKNQELDAYAALYLHILNTYPEDTVTVAVMFKRMLENSESNSGFLDSLPISDEEKELFGKGLGKSDREKLTESIKPLLALLNATTPNAKAWLDIPVIGRHSLLVRTERNLNQSIKRYASWTSDAGARLFEEAQEALSPLKALVDKFESAHAEELQEERDAGKKVAQRAA